MLTWWRYVWTAWSVFVCVCWSILIQWERRLNLHVTIQQRMGSFCIGNEAWEILSDTQIRYLHGSLPLSQSWVGTGGYRGWGGRGGCEGEYSTYMAARHSVILSLPLCVLVRPKSSRVFLMCGQHWVTAHSSLVVCDKKASSSMWWVYLITQSCTFRAKVVLEYWNHKKNNTYMTYII